MQDANETQEITYTRPSVYSLMHDAQQIACDMAALPEDLTTPDAAEQLAAFEHKLDAWLANTTDKQLACLAVKQRAEAEQAIVKAEMARLQACNKAFAALADRMDEKALEMLHAHEALTGEVKMQCADGRTVSLVRTRQLDVQVTELDAVPQAYCKTTTVAVLPEIKAAYKAGKEVPGVTVTERQSESVRWSK